MAASVIAAVLDRLESLTYADPAPKVFFDEAPIRVAGVTVNPPYVVLKDDGTKPTYTAEYKLANEVTAFRLEVYAGSLAGLDAACEAIKYNGGGVSDGLGLDFAAALPVDGQTLEVVMRDGEQRFQEADRADPDAYVFRNTMRYRAAFLRV